ncbi:hypothetical protein GUJ93_ZPchr0013g36366 [Zizania palustris]|uniref:Protein DETOXIFICATION n=1 Tax=Zizania palustris TaxID=103762 RepID=A0A8J6BZL5_ZIZPA|nr:hypothetical protein GUJ93_ZPchr0013g36366 [Zizania palustris]
MGTASGQQYPPPLSSSPADGGDGDGGGGGGGSPGRDGEEEAAGAQLERIILADESAPRAWRVARAAQVELRLLAALAAPAVAVYMINYAMSMSTRIICGQLGTLELAAASLGNIGIQAFSYGLMDVEKDEECHEEALPLGEFIGEYSGEYTDESGGHPIPG